MWDSANAGACVLRTVHASVLSVQSSAWALEVDRIQCRHPACSSARRMANIVSRMNAGGFVRKSTDTTSSVALCICTWFFMEACRTFLNLILIFFPSATRDRKMRLCYAHASLIQPSPPGDYSTIAVVAFVWTVFSSSLWGAFFGASPPLGCEWHTHGLAGRNTSIK